MRSSSITRILNFRFKEEGIARVRVQILAEQSLRLEALAKRGEFPSFSVYEKEEMPDVVAATEPRVSLKSTKKTNVKSKKSQSALDLITKSRVGE